jgi:hypothetical protein
LYPVVLRIPKKINPVQIKGKTADGKTVTLNFKKSPVGKWQYTLSTGSEEHAVTKLTFVSTMHE